MISRPNELGFMEIYFNATCSCVFTKPLTLSFSFLCMKQKYELCRDMDQSAGMALTISNLISEAVQIHYSLHIRK